MKKEIKQTLEPWFQGHNLKWLEDRTIFLTVHGSRAYGTSTPSSDIDIKGLVIPPKEYFHGFSKSFEQAEATEPYDMVIFGLHKFMKLAADCNPNIIEILFTDPEDWIFETEIFNKLWAHRELFLSRKARFTFSGYAHQQLKRIKGHKRWLLEPPTHKPTREEHGLPVMRKLSASELGATQKLIEGNVKLDDSVMHLFNLEQKYQSALREWQQYENWKRNRNKKRAELEAKFGYDCKHALHLVRLMRMCREILTDGTVLVRRPDAQELLAIRDGAWAYDELIEWAEKQDGEMEALFKTSPLPQKPDVHKIDKLCQELVEEAIERADLSSNFLPDLKL